MIQIKLSPSRLWLLMVAIVAGICTSCSDITDSGGDTSLPDGKYPMTFSAAVDGLTVSRAATGKDAWTVNDEIAISVDGGARSEKYKITSISSVDGTGTLAPATDGECCYWQQNKDQQILAWYPAASAPDPSANPTASYVDISNQQNGFSDFDYLTANVTTDFTTDAVSLPFKHQMAKVKCTLEAGEGINDTDLQSAEVKISGYTQVTFTKGTLSGIGDNGWITPGSDREALVVPQDMAGKQFIKVTIGTGNAARDYYYTPDNSTDGNLEAGKAYNYTITVTKTGLEVTVTGNGASWGSESSLGDSSPSEIAYQVTIPQVEGMPSFTITNLSSKAKDDIYTVSDASFSISYTVPTDDKGMTGFTPRGLCNVERKLSSEGNGTNTYTFTYTNIHSDILLTYGPYTQMGDFYCRAADGTGYVVPGDATLTDTQKAACLGIVLKAGKDDSGNWKDEGNYTLKGTDTKLTDFHGYVLALYDAAASDGDGSLVQSFGWGPNGTIYIGTDQSWDALFCGYINTQIIKEYAERNKKDLATIFAATYYATDGYEAYENGKYASPSNSSGWFFPSAGQCQYWGQNKDFLLAAMKKASGNDSYAWGEAYWSSSEYSYNAGYTAWFMRSSSGGIESLSKFNPICIRPLLAF